MKFIFVNLLVISSIFISSCGFQLNRNQVRLMDQARSISITQVENKTFIPKLDIQLKSALLETLSKRSIPIQGGENGDLLVGVAIDHFEPSRIKYSLVDGVQTYSHTFSLQGDMEVHRSPKWKQFRQTLQESTGKKKGKRYPKKERVTLKYVVQSTAEDLTQNDVDTYRARAITLFADKVTLALTNSF